MKSDLFFPKIEKQMQNQLEANMKKKGGSSGFTETTLNERFVSKRSLPLDWLRFQMMEEILIGFSILD